MRRTTHPTPVVSTALAICLFLTGCGSDGGRGAPVSPDAAVRTDTGGAPEPVACDPSVDTDGDGIADGAEGDGDVDRDGAPNFRDADADEDGYGDTIEQRSGRPCAPADTDIDGTPDFLDQDSDNDGLPDREELRLGTDPLNIDTDLDGVTDLGEVAGTGTDPLDPADTIREGDFFVVLPYQDSPEERTLRFSTYITIADIFFLVDMTGSMGGERTNLIRGLQDVIIPGVEASVDDAQYGVAGLDDYPVSPYGSGSDRPFYLLHPIIPADQDEGAWTVEASATSCPWGGDDIGRIEGAPNGRSDLLEAVEGLPCHSGSDTPESYVPALWAAATGEGLSWSGGAVPAQSCPAVPDEFAPRYGYPCFRPGAQPIFLLFGDADFHNGPGGANPYNFTAPDYGLATEALNSIGARVIGIFSGDDFSDSNSAHYEQLASDTGTVREDGTPLVFTIDSAGSGLDTTVVDAVTDLVSGTPQDVSTRTQSLPGNPDEFDASRFITSIRPVEGYTPSGSPGGYDSRGGGGFLGVAPGTAVDFLVTFQNHVRPAADSAQIFRAKIIVVGNQVTDLDERQVFIVVPPESGDFLI